MAQKFNGTTNVPITEEDRADFYSSMPPNVSEVTGLQDELEALETGKADAADAAAAQAAANAAAAAASEALDRANHTGTQEISTVAGLQAELNAKVSAASASPVTALPSALDGADRIMVLRGDPAVAHYETLANLQSFLGAPPAPTPPAAMTVGQWTAEATLVAGQMGINIVTLPSDGGSAITALEYRVGTGAAVALSGTGTGLRTVTSGFSAGVAADIQVRAVNAVGAGAWSDTKNRTPLAGGGGAAYGATGPYTTGFNSITINRPAGATAADTITAIIASVNGVSPATMATPDGWTAVPGGTDTGPAPGDERAMRVFTAPGDVPELTFVAAGLLVALSYSTNAPLRNMVVDVVDYASPSPANDNNSPTPSVARAAGDLVVSSYLQPEGPAPMPTPGNVAPYTRAYHLNGAAQPFASVLWLAGGAAGNSGPVPHDSLGAFTIRFLVTAAYGS